MLYNVLYVPELKYNLLSVSKAAKFSKRIVFNKNKCHIVDCSTEETIGSAIKVGELYYLECTTREEEQQATKESVYVRNMEKALMNVKKNNFKVEMMERLDLVQEDKRNRDILQNSMEEKKEQESYVFQENNLNSEKSTVFDKCEAWKDVLKAEIKTNEQTLQEDITVERKCIEDAPCDMSNYTLLHLTLYLLFIDPTSIYIYTVNDRCDLFDSASHQILVDHNTSVTTSWRTKTGL